MTSCLLCYEKCFTVKTKALLPIGANSFLLEQTRFQKGGRNNFDGVA